MITPIDLSERAPLPRLWLIVAGWTIVALLQALALHYLEGLWLRFDYGLQSAVLNYTIMGLLVWVACRLNVLLQLWNQPPLRALAAYLGLAATGVATWCAFELLAMRLILGPDYWTRAFAASWMFQLLTATFTFVAAFALGLVVQTFDREHERREREARLEAAAHAAQIDAIKGQLRPHFLLNSLNSILALVDDDPAEARRMIGRLSSLLHTVFDGLDEPFVPLERELALLEDYLEVERIRFGDRLRFTVEAEAGATDALLPPLLLQPLVENAVRHGIEPNPVPGTLAVRARVDGGRLQIQIDNTANGLQGHGGTGRGLELTRQRLRAMYGDQRFDFHAGSSATGFTASLDLPRVPHSG